MRADYIEPAPHKRRSRNNRYRDRDQAELEQDGTVNFTHNSQCCVKDHSREKRGRDECASGGKGFRGKVPAAVMCGYAKIMHKSEHSNEEQEGTEISNAEEHPSKQSPPKS